MIECFVKELVLRKVELKSEIVETIYFGGGTPSILTIADLRLLIDTVSENYKVIENPEITLEANPDDLMAVRSQSRTIFEEYYQIGINRLSIGIQSFFDDDLRAMNRAHNAKEARESLSVATRNFDNITIDLIYGIPTMTNQRWKENLQIAFDSGVNHISSYALTVEPKTALDSFIKKGKYPPIDEEKALAHFNMLVNESTKIGFVQYEISNFGKPDYFSKHNTSYWLGKSYVGIGPSAHSFDGQYRSWNISNNVKYIKAIQQNELPSERELLSTSDRFNETVMTGLRTIWGVSLEQVEQVYGFKYKQYLLSSSEKYIKQKLLILEKCSDDPSQNILKITKKGKFLVDGIAAELFMI